MKKLEVTWAFLMIFSATPLFAASSPTVPANNPCMSDIHKYCKNIIPGEGRLARCMKSHASELSSSCKQYGKEYVKAHPEIQKSLESSG